MDAALLLIASNEPCPQPQTSEHLAAVEIMRLKYIIILQNKIDLIKEGQAREQYEQVRCLLILLVIVNLCLLFRDQVYNIQKTQKHYYLPFLF